MRYACDVLEEMRKAAEHKHYRHFPGLIEELQSMFNRMEAGLQSKHEVENLRKTRKKLEAEIEELEEYKESLEDNITLDQKIKDLQDLKEAGERFYHPERPKKSNKGREWDLW